MHDDNEQNAAHQKGTVLVVDDEPIIVRRLKILLEQLGYRVSACTDSEAALESLERQHFDLIITDLMMRKNDGFKILETARTKDRNMRVIIITGLGNRECINEALDRGASGCISKPFTIGELQDAMNRAEELQEQSLKSAAG